MRKNCSRDWEKLLKFEAEGQEFAKFLRWTIYSKSERSEQFMVTECFLTCFGGFSNLENQNNHNSNWKELLGYKNLQEKWEN